MAGEITVFYQARVDAGNKINDYDTDTFKFALVTATAAPAYADAAPHFGGTGTTDYATNECTPGGNYAAGGPALTSVTFTTRGGTNSGATTDATGYAIGVTSITLASAGTGTILEGDVLTFGTDTNEYIVKTGDADVSGGGTIVLATPLLVAIPASATAITTKLVPVMRAAKVSIAQHASNPTDARYGIIYNSTDANKRALAWADLDSVRDLSGGLFEYRFNNVDGTGTVLKG